jgi:anti-sigma factor RsiW
MADARTSDFEKLNALVDGELAPAERAELAARLAVDRELASAHATLAHLKAAVAESAGDCPPIALERPRPSWLRRYAVPIAACVVLAIGTGFFALRGDMFDRDNELATAAEGPTAITLASLPAGTTVPRLDTAGLKLIGLAFNPGSVPLFTASYRGPHGCRLDLRAWPVGADAVPAHGTSLRQWVVGGLVYELTAHGMPAWRFAIIADGAEEQTRVGADPDRVDRRLHEANRGAPPCVG